jgi:phosphohistidine phosphatase
LIVRLYLLRHGIPVEPERWPGLERMRPLTPEGREETLRVIEAMQFELGQPAIWASPFSRTQETAKIASEKLGAPLQTVAGLASGCDLLRTLPALQGDPSRWPERLLLVGHQPDLGVLAGELEGDDLAAYGLGRAGMACLEGEFRFGGMKLEWVRTARELISLGAARLGRGPR